jgi:hypothetical protein
MAANLDAVTGLDGLYWRVRATRGVPAFYVPRRRMLLLQRHATAVRTEVWETRAQGGRNKVYLRRLQGGARRGRGQAAMATRTWRCGSSCWHGSTARQSPR